MATESHHTFTGFTDAQRAFLAAPRYGTVATLRPDGTPMLFTVWYDLDGDDIWFISARNTAKLRQIARDPRVAFHVVDANGFPYFAANGTATITDATDMAPRLQMATRYFGPERAQQWLAQNPAPAPPVIIRITIERTNSMEG